MSYRHEIPETITTLRNASICKGMSIDTLAPLLGIRPDQMERRWSGDASLSVSQLLTWCSSVGLDWRDIVRQAQREHRPRR